MQLHRPSVRLVIAGLVAVTTLAGCLTSIGRVSAGPPPARHPATRSTTARSARPLAGVTVGIDPGHNGKNYAHPKYLHRQIWNGREWEDCNTAGTATNGGYPEPRFTWRVAKDLRADLRREGAHVVMTRHNNHGVGPCVNRRAHIINHVHAKVGIDIH